MTDQWTTGLHRLFGYAAGLVLVALVVSCGGNPSPATTDSMPTPSGSLPTTESTTSKRDRLISALQNLSAVFRSRDAQQVASLFPFPVPDTVLQVYSEDPAFAKALEKSKGQLTREIFIDYFPAISESVMLPEIDSLFRYLSPADLAARDTLEKVIAKPYEPCATYYRLAIEGEMVVLVTGTDSNELYKGDDGGSEGCESASVWVFYFNGERLVLKQQGLAG